MRLLCGLAWAGGAPGLTWERVAEHAALVDIADGTLRTGLRALEEDGQLTLSPGWRFLRLTAPSNEPAAPPPGAAESACEPARGAAAWAAWPTVRQALLGRAREAAEGDEAAEAAMLRAAAARAVALRRLCLARWHGLDTEGGEALEAAPRPGVPVPKGCLCIDQALAASPPEVAGTRVSLVIPPRRPARTQRQHRRGRKGWGAVLREQAREVARRAVAHERWRSRVARAREGADARRRSEPESPAAVRAWHVRDRVRRREIDAAAAAEERCCKAPRCTVAAAAVEAARREQAAVARAAAEALAMGERVEAGRAARAGRRGLWASARARRESIHIRYGPGVAKRAPAAGHTGTVFTGSSARARLLLRRSTSGVVL